MEKERNYLTRQELNSLLAAIDHEILYPFIFTMIHTGMRVSECLNLKLADVNLNERIIFIRKGKGGKHKELPMSPQLVEQLTSYLTKVRPDTDSLLFFSLKRTGEVIIQYVNKILQVASQKAGINKHVTSHILRHSFASFLVKQETHIAVIQKLLGHASLKTTSVYVHVPHKEMREAVERFDFG
ncbi:tyrosine-type recombinase/integrase [Sporosarcina sp. FSL W7-1283]|uniref:tyrosine-type recombinase/integrase n=1 Tax=Sporosarcina sp. FSL W7-1283 TaxID=2921560 RepID=UPI0030FA5D56